MQVQTQQGHKPLPLWKNTDYVYLWLSRTVSQFGDKLFLLALPWLVLEMTNSVVSTTLTLALELIPQVILAPLVGVLIDRASRKVMMVITDMIRAIILISIPVLFHFDALSIAMIYTAAILLAVFTLLFDSASEAYIPTILPQEQLMDGNAKLVMVATIMRIVGPAASGMLITFIGVAYTIGLTGISFLLSMVFLTFIANTSNAALSEQNQDGVQPEKQEGATKLKSVLTRFTRDVNDGFLYLIKHPILWPITVFNAVMNFGIMGVTSLFIFESKVNQGASADLTAMIFWVSGIFTFLATLVIKPLNRHVSKGQIVRFGSIGVCCSVLLVAVSPSLVTMIVCYTLLLVIGIFVNVSLMTLRQEIVPNELLGRVLTTNRVLAQSIAPIAIILAGIIAHVWNVQTVFVLGSALIGINVLYAWFGKMRTIE